jgi:hypothetical protein
MMKKFLSICPGKALIKKPINKAPEIIPTINL